MRIMSFIAGESKAIGEPTIRLLRPQDESETGTILEAGAAGAHEAVASALAAYTDHRKANLHQRISWLQAAASALEADVEAFAKLISHDIGKPIRLARFEVKRGADFLRATAWTAAQVFGEVIPLDAVPNGTGCIGMVRRAPYGVVAALTPFNAPINLLIQKLAPAIVTGNALVAKPAPAGSRTALRLAELCSNAGWPSGLFNVLSGDKETAVALVAHPAVRAVSFTGGTEAAAALIRAAGPKKFVAELGSNAANVVLADSELNIAAGKLAVAAFEASGQQCISAQRILVQQAVLDDFIPLLVSAAKAMKVGPADDPNTDIGPMIHRAAAMRVMTMISDAKVKGAREVLAATRDGSTVTPGILVDVSRDARLWREEVFGPVVVVVSFNTEDEALQLANDSEFGLQGAVFTKSLASALRFAEEFEVGALWINEASRFRLDVYPFGGVKSSGFGREGLRYAIEEMSQPKFVGIRQ